MSIPRVFTSALSCRACRTVIVRSTPKCSTLRSSIPTASIQRSISTTPIRADTPNPPTEDTLSPFLEDDNGAFKTTAPPEAAKATEVTEAVETTPSAPKASPLPWYLQNRPTPIPQQASVIPDLPPNPPPLLATLLDYISTTAGLDDLTILDLRHLDPPPALGPKLIMIICTARSEKHLHVSADRFCRWLRREHHLRANAAGLLGRNELKIKLRRKAKRMKMLANVGATEHEGVAIDDGIRTGWICCTLGKIEAHELDRDMPGDDVEGFVGFRDVKPGVNVVFQMFTEEKRADTDLETLWGGVLKSGERKDKKAENMLKELEEKLEEEVDVDEVEEELQTPRAQRRADKTQKTNATTSPPTPTFTTTRPSPSDIFPDLSDFQQIRRLHTVGLRT